MRRRCRSNGQAVLQGRILLMREPRVARTARPGAYPGEVETQGGETDMHTDSFHTKGTLDVGGASHQLFRLKALAKSHPASARLPFSLKVLLENLLRHEDGRVVRREHVEKMVAWDAKAAPETEISFYVARVLLQDFTG